MAQIAKQVVNLAYEVAGDVDFFLANQATSASATTTVHKGDFLNNLNPAGQLFQQCVLISVDPGGTTASVPAGDVTLAGIAWDPTSKSFIHKTDTITFSANDTDPLNSSVPFLDLQSITFPVQDGAGATYDVGIAATVDIRFPNNGQQALAIASLRTVIQTGATASELLTYSIDSGVNANFDQTLYSLDPTDGAATSDFNDFAVPQFVMPGDVLLVSFLNSLAGLPRVNIQIVGIYL